MISANLLHALGYEEDSYDELTTNRILDDSNYPSVYDLMNECKILMMKWNYRLDSYINFSEQGECKIYVMNDGLKRIRTMVREKESEAVFAACDHILEEKWNH